MKPGPTIKKLFAKSRVRVSDSLDDKILGDALSAFDKSAKTGSDAPSVWRTILKSRITKLAVAAVIIVAVAVGLIQWLPSGEGEPVVKVEVEIPTEVTQMPVDKLMEIHFGKAESEFDASVIAAAVEQALGKLGAIEVLALAGKFGGRSARRSARMRYHPKPLSAAVEAADIIIRARINRFELDANDLKASIVERNLRWIEDYVGWIRADVELEVLEGYPKLPAEDGGTLLLKPVFSTDRLNLLEQGKEYIIALHERGQIIWMLPYGEGIYPVDPNNQMVSGFRAGPMPLDDAWHFISDCYDAIHEGNEPPEEALDYWTDKLQSDKLTDNWTAVEYFNTLAEPPINPQIIAEAVERQIKTRNEKYQRATFAKEAFNLLIKLGDPNTNRRMAEIYENEHTLDNSIFNEDFAGVYANSFAEQVTRLVPSTVSKADDSRPKPKPQLSGAEKIDRVIQQYRAGEKSLGAVVSEMRKHLTSKDVEFIPFLKEVLTKHWEIPGFIATRIPDPCFVEPLREAIANKYHGDFVRALYACGEQDETIELAYTHLADYVYDPNRRELALGNDSYSMWLTIRLLGESGDKSVCEVIQAATYDDVFRGRFVSNLQGAAIMALARLGGDSAIERLRELYASNDYYMRIAAAVSLYYLGDDSGYDLLEHFVNHTERSVPGIEMRWHVDMHGGEPFHAALLYLRSPKTDQLFIGRLRNGVGDKDIEALVIAEAYKAEVLPILVEHLSSRNRTTRENAYDMLKGLTGKNFGFDPCRFVGQQEESIEKWRSYVEQYLAEPNDLAK